MTICGKFVTGYFSPDRDNPDSEHWIELRTAYPCSVEIGGFGSSHEGPCAATEQPQTVSARQRWLAADQKRQEDLRHHASGLAEYQGRPLTFAEGQGADPAVPHPAQEVGCPLCPARMIAKDLPSHLRQVHGSTIPDAVHDASAPVPTRAHREHDQDLPQPNDRPVMHTVLLDLINQRLSIGIERYGTGMQPMNGRDAYRDLVEELVDAAVYTLQIQHERDEMLVHMQRIYDYLEDNAAKKQIDSEILERCMALIEWLATGDHTSDRRT